jgi:hypothetical protein
MSFEFIIPATKDDLLNKTEINQFVVDEVLSLRDIPGALQGRSHLIILKGHDLQICEIVLC